MTSSSSSSSGAASRVTGLVSGFDTSSIVESLMAIEKKPFAKLEVKKQTEELKLQAYQAVNTYLLKFRTSMSTLSASKLWNSKTAASSNDKSLGATASQYAVQGTYSFKVAQLATAAQSMTKGFASKTAPLADIKNAEGDTVNEKIGSISLNSSKTRVDNSALLEELNGGKGIYRGSIRVTDGSNNSSVIDLSSCSTMDDVVSAINNSDKAQISASIKDGALHIEDNSRGTGSLRIQNVGTGTTATDLGIAGTTDHGSSTNLSDGVITTAGGKTALQGRNVYTIGNDTALSKLNDGLGVEEGRINLKISDATSYINLSIDTTDCKSVGDLTKKINAVIEDKRKNGGIDHTTGGNYGTLLEGLTFGLSADKLSFGLTGVKQGQSYEFSDPASAAMGKATPAQQLGLADGVHTISASSGDSIAFKRVIGDVNSPMLKSLGGLDSTSSTKLGEQQKVDVAFTADTKLSSMYGGNGMDWSRPMQILLTEGGSSSASSGTAKYDVGTFMSKDGFDAYIADRYQSQGGKAEPTVGDLLDYMNRQVANVAADPSKNAAGLAGMRFKMEDGSVTIEGAQAGYKVEIIGTVAAGLGLTRINTESGEFSMNTALDGYTDQGDKYAADIDKFYGITDHKSLLASGVVDMNPDTATLQDLVGFHGLKRADFGTDEDYATAVGTKLQDMFDQPDGIKINTTHNLVLADGSSAHVPVSMQLSLKDVAVLDKDGNVVPGAKLDENTDVATFMRSVNAAVQDTLTTKTREAVANFATDIRGGAYTEAEIPAARQQEILAAADAFAVNGTVSAPEMRLHAYGDSLQWSNMDFSRDWEMGGEVLENLHMDKSIDISSGQQANAMLIPTSAQPKEVGYYSGKDVTADTKLKDLNASVGLFVGGGEDDTIDFSFGEDADGNAVTISLTMQEIKEAVAAKGGPDCKLGDYVQSLDTLLKAKLGAYNSEKGTTLAVDIGLGADANGKMQIQVKNVKGMPEIEDRPDSDRFSISGSGINADPKTMLLNLGIGQMSKDNPDPAATFTVSNLIAADFIQPTAEEMETTSLGRIEFTLGNSDKRIALETDGLDEYSTLNDLLNHLNDQLGEMAKAGSGYTDAGGNFVAYTDSERSAFKNMSFRVSDAGTGIALDNNSSQRVTFKDTIDANGNSDSNRLGQTLGLLGVDNADVKVESYSRYNGASLGRNYISRATSLDDFLGKDATKGVITLTNAAGVSQNLDMSNCKTIGDVIDAINSYGNQNFGIFARINSAGNGLDIYEAYSESYDPEVCTKNISIKDVDNGTLAKKLGIAGTGTRLDENGGRSIFEGSLGLKIDVMSSDSLESIMYRLAASGDYKCAIINDGSASHPFRLTIASATTGEASDFVIDSNLAEMFGFSQSTRGKDAKVLYGDPNSSASPIMLSSSTNTNSTAVLGLTLDMKSVSTDWTTITVDEDKEGIKEEIKNMVQAYNDLAGMVSYLDAYDEETGEPGILFGDTSVRGLMDEINEYFYQIFNPNNANLGSVDADGKQQTWTWMDLGVSLSSKNTNADGTGSWYTTMDLDLDKLDEMFAAEWDVVSQMLSNSRNASNVNGSQNNKPVASFNGKLAEGFTTTGAINGDATKGGWGAANGVMAGDTITNGANQYSIFFQQPTTMTRMSIYHYSADTALQDFKIEYMDTNGDWQTFRDITGNKSDTNHLGTAMPLSMQALRITANSTNAKDDTFRLLDVQVYEEIGLAGSLNQLTQKLGDTKLGFLAERTEVVNNSISDLDSQMSKLQTKLDAKEESLWRRFTAMETALGKMQNQGSYFSSMMSGMNKK